MLTDAAEYLRNAYCIAAQSRDNSNQNGAVLVSAKKELISTGVNNFAIGVEFTEERATTRPKKYRYFDHAERNAIYLAARSHSAPGVFGSTMYCPWASCCPCAIGIINSGVRTLVMHRERMQMTPPRWEDDVNEALGMMKEAGLTLLYYEGPVEGAPPLIVNGETWDPSDPIMVKGDTYFVDMGE